MIIAGFIQPIGAILSVHRQQPVSVMMISSTLLLDALLFAEFLLLELLLPHALKTKADSATTAVPVTTFT